MRRLLMAKDGGQRGRSPQGRGAGGDAYEHGYEGFHAIGVGRIILNPPCLFNAAR
jgi:hypothetical protein